LVRSVAHYSILHGHMRPTLGRNAQYCCERYSVPLHAINYCHSVVERVCLKRYTQADYDHVLLILELVKVKRRFLTIDNMTEQDASMLIDYVCSF